MARVEAFRLELPRSIKELRVVRSRGIKSRRLACPEALSVRPPISKEKTKRIRKAGAGKDHPPDPERVVSLHRSRCDRQSLRPAEPRRKQSR